MNMLVRVLMLLSVCAAAATTLFGAEINACKYLIVADFASDPYGLANELRVQASARGFQSLTSARDVPPGEGLKACSMVGSLQPMGLNGYLSMRVLDASDAVIGEASARFHLDALIMSYAVRHAVNKIYSQLGYTGFDERMFKEVLDRKYPKRPTLAITEETIKKTEPHNSIEGIWTDTEDLFSLGIIRAPELSGADYVAVVLATHSALWQPGEVKAEIRTTAAPDVFTCTYFMQNKKPIGTTLTMEHDSLLRGSAAVAPNGQFTLTLMRVWPKGDSPRNSDRTEARIGSSGSGFLLNADGLPATNWPTKEGTNGDCWCGPFAVARILLPIAAGLRHAACIGIHSDVREPPARSVSGTESRGSKGSSRSKSNRTRRRRSV